MTIIWLIRSTEKKLNKVKDVSIKFYMGHLKSFNTSDWRRQRHGTKESGFTPENKQRSSSSSKTAIRSISMHAKMLWAKTAVLHRQNLKFVDFRKTFRLDIMPFNIRSSTRNCRNLQNYLATWNFCPSVIVLSKTLQNDSTEICNFTGYKGFFSSNGKNRSSVVAIFVCNSLNVIDEQCISNFYFDNLSLSLQVTSQSLSEEINGNKDFSLGHTKCRLEGSTLFYFNGCHKLLYRSIRSH